MNIFYIICPIGFEEIVIQEIEIKWSKIFPAHSYKVLNKGKGGIELECPLENGLSLNKILKAPTRILLRIKSQKCRDLPKLFKILKKIDWKIYLKQENVEFVISAKKSRLIHTTRIENTAIDALYAYFKANAISQKEKEALYPTQKIFLRLDEDNLEISLDTSGQLLHRRGHNEFRGHAGLRENYASSMLLFLLGYHAYKDNILVDPMCGSTTFLSEACDFHKFNNRSFAFENWRINSDLNLIQMEPIYDFSSLHGFDIDPNIINYQKHPNIELKIKDFFKQSHIKNSIIILNPPYGKRVKIKGSKQKYFNEIIQHIKDIICPIKFGIIIPEQYCSQFHPSRSVKLNQNGIKVRFLVFE